MMTINNEPMPLSDVHDDVLNKSSLPRQNQFEETRQLHKATIIKGDIKRHTSSIASALLAQHNNTTIIVLDFHYTFHYQQELYNHDGKVQEWAVLEDKRS